MKLCKRMGSLFFRLSALVMAFAPGASAQLANTATESGVPIVTGNFSFQTSFQPGMQALMPEFDPVILAPIGRKLLVESEFDMFMNVERTDGQWGPGVVEHGVEYLQLDYFVHPNLTIVAGRFLTPFGIYRERLHPMWIRNLADEPIIFTMNDNSSNGAMLRGSARVTSGMNVTYESYYSVATTNSQLFADRRTGGRGSLFFPNKRVEVGVSFSRVLNQRYDMVGADLTWTPRKIPFDLRSEFIHSAKLGTGYWVEGAYRLKKLGTNAFLRNSELAIRGEQYRVPQTPQFLNTDLPTENTTRTTLGWNYYMHNGIRLDAAYGRNFANGASNNIWTAGMTYRFAFF